MKKQNFLQFFYIFLVLLLFFSHIYAEKQDIKETLSWKFIVTGDSRGNNNGINVPILNKLKKEIIKEKPKFVLFPGDLINGYTDFQKTINELTYWRNYFMEPLHKKGIKVYPCRGNHELLKNGHDSSDAWNEVFKDKYALPDNGPYKEKNLTYSFSYNNAFFIALDLYINPNKVNQKWLNTQLENNSSPHIFVYAHEPIYSLMGGHYDCLAVHKKERDTFIESIIEAGGCTYFCGHDHWYNHAKIEFLDEKWFHQFVVGTAGAPLRHWSSKKYRESDVIFVAHDENFGYMVVEINGKKVTMIMKTLSENEKLKIVDSFSYTK